MTPIRLWSTEVIHSRHRYGQYPFTVIHAEDRAPSPGPPCADAPMMIGWSNGIALQLSLPRRFIFLPSVTPDGEPRGIVGCMPALTMPLNRSGATAR